VDPNGLCYECAPFIVLNIQNHTRIIDDSVNLINRSKNKATRLSRCDLLIEHAQALVPYHAKGIPTVEPSPAELIRLVQDQKHEIILEDAQQQVEKWLDKARVAATVRTALTNGSKALLAITEARKELGDPSTLADREAEVKRFLHETELAGYLDEAKKAEFKGNRKKALDQY
jgi:hypothetical protein